MPGDDRRSQLSPLRITLQNSELKPDEIDRVVDVTVEQDLFMPAAFAIRIRDTYDKSSQSEQGYCRLLDQDRFKIGGAIVIAMAREAAPQTVFTGEVTSIELEFEQDGAPVLTVRGYDRSHRLRRECKTRTFVNMSDVDIVRKIASENGLSADISASSSGLHEHLFQDNQTDWEFLRARADRTGSELLVNDRKLVFRAPSTSQVAPSQALGETLQRLRVRLSTSAQVGEVVVQGWDPESKRQVSGQVKAPTVKANIGESKSGADLAKSGFGKPGKFVLSETAVGSAGEARALAQSLYDEISGDFIQLEGVCLGDPGVGVGKMIPIKGVSRRLNGKYYLSAVKHRLTAREGYLTHFTVSGRRPNTLSGLLNGSGNGHHSGSNGRHAGVVHPGVVIGLVTNNKDDKNQGRVKVKFPWLADGEESAWARVASPMAGGGRGLFWLPEVNDEVLVAFEHGDINRPYVVGGVWNGKDKPPENASKVVGPTGKVDKRIIKSRSGHTITLDDSDGTPSISIVDKSGQNSITIDTMKKEITVKAAMNMTFEAGARMSLKGQVVQIESSGQLNLKGAVSNVEASGGPLVLKGAVIKLN